MCFRNITRLELTQREHECKSRFNSINFNNFAAEIVSLDILISTLLIAERSKVKTSAGVPQTARDYLA